MKKILFIALMAIVLAACSSKVYNTQLKQVELGMTKEDVVQLMGKDYIQHRASFDAEQSSDKIEYKDRYKNHWFFEFSKNHLTKWYKEVEK